MKVSDIMTLDQISKSDAFSLAVRYGKLITTNSAFIAQAKQHLIADNGMNRQSIAELSKLYVAQEKYEAGFALHKDILFEDGYASAEYALIRACNADNASSRINSSDIEEIHASIDVMENNLANMDFQPDGVEIEFTEKYVRQIENRAKSRTLIDYGFLPETDNEKISTRKTRAKNGYGVKRISQKSRLGLSGKGRMSNAQLAQLAQLDAQE